MTMKRPTATLIRGVGSLVDLWPARDLRTVVPRRTASERMAESFRRVGRAIEGAADRFEHEQAARQKTSKAA